MRLFKTGRFYFLQPLAYMGKDFNDSFKQFKSPYYIKRDFLQPYHGAENIFNGSKNIGYGITTLNGGLIALGVADILRGVTRILTTPLTWFIRMPLRGLITAFTGYQKAESGTGIQNEVKKGRAILDAMEECNINVSELIKSYQSRQKFIEQRTSLYGQQLEQNNPQLKQETDQKMKETDKNLLRVLDELEKSQKEILPQANEVADTIVIKYEKALKRGQATDLPSNIEPLTVNQNESKKFITGPFIAGLKLFDRDKSGLNILSWTLNDSGRSLQPNRCA